MGKSNKKGNVVEYVVTKDGKDLTKQEMEDEAKEAVGKLNKAKPGGVSVLRIRGATKNC